jgi:glycosidase
VVKNTEEDAGFASYHGYWTQDFLRPNAHFGDLTKLRELVDKAHARGMLVILDVVTNHVGQLFYYDINGNGQPDDTISRRRLRAHLPADLRAEPRELLDRRADLLRQGQGLPRADHRVGSRVRPARHPGLDVARLLGPGRHSLHRLARENRTPPPRPPSWFGWPDDKPWFDDASWYNRKGRVYVWWHEATTRRTSSASRRPRRLPRWAEGPQHRQPRRAKEALIKSFEYWIEVADFDGFRIDTVKHIDRPELARNVRGFWGVFADRMRAKAASLGKQNFFIFGEASTATTS